MAQDDASAWEPTVELLVSWTALVAAVAALPIVAFTRSQYTGMETIGYAAVGILALAAAVACGAAGMVAAGIGLKRARDREIRVPALTAALVLNVIAFWTPFLMTGC